MEKPVLLKSVQVLDPRSPWHGQTVDVLIKGDTIADVGNDLKGEGKSLVLTQEGSAISPGWIDAQAHFREPGEETKEGFTHGLKAASAGGFTTVALLPSTEPPMDTAASMQWVINASQRAHEQGIPSKALPMACISERRKGEQLSEMHDLHQSGAVAFTDDAPIDRPGLLQRALTYAQTHQKVVIDQPFDEDVNAGGVMHEGKVSTMMGLTGTPAEAETMRVARDLDVLRYTGGKLHLAVLSSAQGVELVRAAKREGLQVTCGTSVAHLLYCDEDLSGFQGVLRNAPPFRSATDREALRQGVIDGTIDLVVSDHRPEDLEAHDVEFMLSPHGMATLPSAFAMALTGLAEQSPSEALEGLLRSLTTGPANHLGIDLPVVDKGSGVNLTWFHPTMTHQPVAHSKGANLPPLGATTKGQVLGTFLSTRAWTA